MSYVIQGFSPSDRVPGFYGEVVPGAGGQGAAGLPLALLVCGLSTGGNIVNDTEMRQVFTKTDADTAAGAGSEGATMLYDAIAIGAAQGVPIWYMSPTPAAGATQATAILTIGGTWTSAGSLGITVNGVPIAVTVGATDTPSTVATNLAAALAGFDAGRSPVVATAASGALTAKCVTPGQRGMQHVVFVDKTNAPAGLTATWYTTWATATTYAVGAMVIPIATNGYYYKATAITTGTSGGSPPAWPTTIGSTVVDSGVTWTCWGQTVTSSANLVGVMLGNGTGLESYTNLLATIANVAFDRIALAANDAVSIAAWKSQVDSQAGSPSNILQEYVIAGNGSLTASTSLAQTTTNDPRGQFVWMLNAETHPSRIAAAVAALRAMNEAADPNAPFNSYMVPTIAPYRFQADIPSHATQVSALNNSVTPLETKRGDAHPRIVRSITTKSLTNGNPDYTTFDTGQMSTLDFVFRDERLYWQTVLGPNNKRVQDNPGPDDKRPPSGVMYPALLKSYITAKANQYAAGILAGSSPTVEPICLPPQPGDIDAWYDSASRRVMFAHYVRVMPNNAQCGASVRGA